MDRKLDLQTRRLLAHYRSLPIGSGLRAIRRHVVESGRTLVLLRRGW